MANLSKIKRDSMIAFLEQLKLEHTDDESIRAFNEIENHLREKKYGLVWGFFLNYPFLCFNKQDFIV